MRKISIKFIFQKTRDGRVINYLKYQKFEYVELDDNQPLNIDRNFEIKIQKSDFYDSALIVNIDGTKIFNLNDCPLNDKKDLYELKKLYGSCDFLLTQFSYAAWKGGKGNLEWRQKAANEKLKTIEMQSQILEAKYVIPFASFIYFSDYYNSYLNDSVNTPRGVIEKLKTQSEIFFLKPYDVLYLNKPEKNDNSLLFWDKQYESVKSKLPNLIIKADKQYNITELERAFKKLRNQIFIKNSYLFCKFLSIFPFLKIFKAINIYLEDLDKTVEIDLVNDVFQEINLNTADIKMRSKSLFLIFTQGYGFDTLTVNGCFEEIKKNGFIKMTQSLALGNLNNMGIFLNLKILFDMKVIILFIKKIVSVNKKLNYKYIQTIE